MRCTVVGRLMGSGGLIAIRVKSMTARQVREGFGDWREGLGCGKVWSWSWCFSGTITETHSLAKNVISQLLSYSLRSLTPDGAFGPHRTHAVTGTNMPPTCSPMPSHSSLNPSTTRASSTHALTASANSSGRCRLHGCRNCGCVTAFVLPSCASIKQSRTALASS